MDQDHVLRFKVGEQFHDAFRVRVGAETHVVDLHLDVHYLVIDRDFFFPAENLIADSARHAVPRDDDRVFLKWRPLLECLEGQAAVEHAWGRKENHWLVNLELRLVKLSDMSEIEHVLFDESFLDLLVRPVDEQLVIEVSLLGEPATEVDRVVKSCTVPVSLKQDAKLLSSAKRKHRYEHLASFFKNRVDLLQELSLTGSFRVSDRGRVGGLGQYHVRTQLANPSSTQVPVCSHIVVSCIHECLSVAFDVEHGSAQNMSSVVRGDLHLAIAKCDRLMQ